jgi:hypothetical protein
MYAAATTSIVSCSKVAAVLRVVVEDPLEKSCPVSEAVFFYIWPKTHHHQGRLCPLFCIGNECLERDLRAVFSEESIMIGCAAV